MSRKIAYALAAAVGLAAGSVQAGSLVLQDAGWTASWDDSLDPYLSVAMDINNSTQDAVLIEKKVTFTPDFINDLGFIEPVPIVFQQTSADAKRLVIINDETIENQTGLNWDSFRMTLLQGSTGTDADTRFDPVATGIGTPGGFDVSPFTSATFSRNDQVLDLTDGTVMAGDVWTPGQGTDAGELVITALPVNGGRTFRTFVLKEQPGIGGGGPPPVIPVPPAVWTGLSGLVAMGLFSAVRKFRVALA